jgi:hypothetical protein
MSTQTKTQPQGLLFSEPSYSETGVWCILHPGIDPAEWAGLCRFLGRMGPDDFKKVEKRIVGSSDSLLSRFRRLFRFSSSGLLAIPLISLGPSGIGGEFQREGKIS